MEFGCWVVHFLCLEIVGFLDFFFLFFPNNFVACCFVCQGNFVLSTRLCL